MKPTWNDSTGRNQNVNQWKLWVKLYKNFQEINKHLLTICASQKYGKWYDYLNWRMKICPSNWKFLCTLLKKNPNCLLQESDYFTPQGEYRVDAAGSSTLLNCLMYKLSYYRFGQLQVSYSFPYFLGWGAIPFAWKIE